ncbi:MAG: peptide ABC transporter ATP-binding protein [Armatimonadetes bacterium RBG_16_67_12]|nr:MAG: peptide ABC transporter ATP-binding protein [Armatimonadetes bacterium RBG_16_67_12]
MALLEIRDLHLGFQVSEGVVHALRGVTIQIERGEVLALVGESGCGKTVTMQSVLRLIPEREIAYRRGEIRFGGQDLLRLPESAMRAIRGRQIAMVFQDPTTALNPTLPVGRQVAEAILAHEAATAREAERRTIELFTRVGIPHPELRLRQYPFQLSGGLRQRVVIAAALAARPRLLIADEPTTALDVTIQAQILALLRALQQTYGMAIVLVSHNLGMVAEMAHRVAIMYAGEVVEEGAVDDVFHRPSHPYTHGLLDCLPSLDTRRTERLRSIEGAPPALLDRITGCAFADRCPYALAVCDDYAPPMTDIGPAHRAACWLAHPHALHVPKPAPRTACSKPVSTRC